MVKIPYGKPGYDPIYKVKELMNLLINRFYQLFIPGQCLSLDKNLVRAFGRIKFKVRIISKYARYGIKLYVITDAKSAYVLNILPYAGKDTEISNSTSNDLKEKKKQFK